MKMQYVKKSLEMSVSKFCGFCDILISIYRTKRLNFNAMYLV